MNIAELFNWFDTMSIAELFNWFDTMSIAELFNWFDTMIISTRLKSSLAHKWVRKSKEKQAKFY